MAISTLELAQARETAMGILEELGLDSFLFEVEPQEGEWIVRIECAFDGGWGSITVPVSRDQLLAARSNCDQRQGLLAAWRRQLAVCGRPKGDSL